MTSHPDTARIAVPGPLRRTFSYQLPPGFPSLKPGQRVIVPFGRRKKIGFFLDYGPAPDGVELKRVSEVVDHDALLPDDLVRLCLWMADYYFANPADCFTAALPSQLKSRQVLQFVWQDVDRSMLPRNIARLVKPGRPLTKLALRRIQDAGGSYLKRLIADGVVAEEVTLDRASGSRTLLGYRVIEPDNWADVFRRADRIPEPFHGVRTSEQIREAGFTDYYRRKAIKEGLIEAVYDERPPAILDFVAAREGLRDLRLTTEQDRVVTQVSEAFDGGYKAFLLHGITGSGKTIVYCHLAQRMIEAGRSVLVLTPEIALSSNTLAYFRGFFGGEVTILHSNMTAAERLASWQGIRRGEYKIVIGPRSALFAPLENIGLVIVDEEHDSSYKQDDPSPRFNGRDAALMRAKMNNVPVLLGSASPSVESYHYARSGRWTLLTLANRPAGAKLPTVKLVDMRTQRLGGDLPFVSIDLKKEVDRTLADGKQAILFLNRRGYSPYLKCPACGHVPICDNCRIRMTYHKRGHHLACHYCGAVERNYDVCENCGNTKLLYFGAGTQKVEESAGRLFDGARPVRLDSDTAVGRSSSHGILKEFAAHTYNLLLGTQMVTKGLDLPDVSLVGVLAADMGLDMPDFRASERSFARLLQVAGRSGRTAHPGKVIVQTYSPDRDVINDAARQDYESFFLREIGLRKEGDYPPFSRLVNFILSAPEDDVCERAALQFRDQLDDLVRQSGVPVKLLGPAPCAFHRLRGRFRRHLFAKVRPEKIMQFATLLTEWENQANRFGLPAAVRIAVDVDPADML